MDRDVVLRVVRCLLYHQQEQISKGLAKNTGEKYWSVPFLQTVYKQCRGFIHRLVLTEDPTDRYVTTVKEEHRKQFSTVFEKLACYTVIN